MIGALTFNRKVRLLYQFGDTFAVSSPNVLSQMTDNYQGVRFLFRDSSAET